MYSARVVALVCLLVHSVSFAEFTGPLCGQTYTASDVSVALYVAVMLASVLGFAYLRYLWCETVPRYFYFIHTAIVGWSGLMYLHMFFKTPLADYALYGDWSVSTPLIVLAVGLSAAYQAQRTPWDYIVVLMGLQAAMILTGLFSQMAGATTPGGITFFTIGCILMLPVFYIIWQPLRLVAQATHAAVERKYIVLAAFVIILWCTYPTVWMLGTSGLAWLTDFQTRVAFVVLPIVCKSLFGFLDITLIHAMYDDVHAAET